MEAKKPGRGIVQLGPSAFRRRSLSPCHGTRTVSCIDGQSTPRPESLTIWLTPALLAASKALALEPVQILAIHDDERLIHAGECRFQTCGIVEVADDEFDLGAELRRLRAVAHQGADAVSGFDQVPDHFGSDRAGGASHKDER